MNIAIFLDRDGTINEEKGYLNDPDGLNLLPGAGEAIKKVNDHQIKVVVITNQSGVARGYFSEDQVEMIHQKLRELLKEKCAFLDGIYYCPHHPEVCHTEYGIKCNCRKPAPGMLETASEELGIDLACSYVIGDKIIDVELAYRVGAKGILVLTGYGKEEVEALNSGSKRRPDYVARDILDAVNWVLRDLQENEKWKLPASPVSKINVTTTNVWQK